MQAYPETGTRTPCPKRNTDTHLPFVAGGKSDPGVPVSVPAAVARYIELKREGLGAREARRAARLSGSVYGKWRDYIKSQLDGVGKRGDEGRLDKEMEKIKAEVKATSERIEKT